MTFHLHETEHDFGFENMHGFIVASARLVTAARTRLAAGGEIFGRCAAIFA